MRLFLHSNHLNLSLALISIGVLSSLTAHHVFALCPYPFLICDYVTTTALFVHHSYIGSVFMLGAFTHASLFLVRDYSFGTDLIGRLVHHKAVIISHLSWISLFIGFHILVSHFIVVGILYAHKRVVFMDL